MTRRKLRIPLPQHCGDLIELFLDGLENRDLLDARLYCGCIGM
jgi:hypothetical protein